ncbi:hypothetical protein SLS56_004393 [Neofusicoccum ribis]|uniref:Uncharacterized protein n=1 Tax=Neofusicoccum ribis TaxID=45134 RepID=A0ABR3SWK6_9PEZI
MGHLNNMGRLGTANMILNLHRLFSTRSMASITSLEMSWHLLSSNMTSSNYDPEELASLTRIMPPAFPHLKRLYISLWGRFHLGRRPSPSVVDKSEQALLVPFDAMVSKMTIEMKHCTIALHTSNFDPLYIRAMEADESSDRADWIGCLQFWRAIPQREEGPINHRGYWNPGLEEK